MRSLKKVKREAAVSLAPREKVGLVNGSWLVVDDDSSVMRMNAAFDPWMNVRGMDELDGYRTKDKARGWRRRCVCLGDGNLSWRPVELCPPTARECTKRMEKKERGVASGPTRHCTTLTSLDAVSKGVEKKDAVELFEAWQQSSYRQPLSCYGSH